MRKILKGCRGFSLVEIMVSIFLIIIVVVPVIFIMTHSTAYSLRIDRIYTASNLAKGHMDSLKMMKFSEIAARAPEIDVTIDERGFPDPDGGYVRTTEVTSNIHGNPYLLKVKVTVDRLEHGSAAGYPMIVETIFSDVE